MGKKDTLEFPAKFALLPDLAREAYHHLTNMWLRNGWFQNEGHASISHKGKTLLLDVSMTLGFRTALPAARKKI